MHSLASCRKQRVSCIKSSLSKALRKTQTRLIIGWDGLTRQNIRDRWEPGDGSGRLIMSSHIFVYEKSFLFLNLFLRIQHQTTAGIRSYSCTFIYCCCIFCVLCQGSLQGRRCEAGVGHFLIRAGDVTTTSWLVWLLRWILGDVYKSSGGHPRLQTPPGFPSTSLFLFKLVVTPAHDGFEI